METTDWGLLLTAGLSLAGLTLLRPKKRGASPAPSPGSLPPAARKPCPEGFLPVLPAEELFATTGATPLLTRIRQSAGLSTENHAADIEPLLRNVATFVQLLPASESHHHANPGGLLTHLLEVANAALFRAEEAKLPVGRPTDEQTTHGVRWRYAVLVGALLHDIGKPVADVIVDVVNETGGTTRWSGLAGNMGDYGLCYRVTFPLKKDYSAHQRLPVMLLRAMVPEATLTWLSGDPTLLPFLLQYLEGGEGAEIGAMIKVADQKSVADNLRRGSRTRFSTAQAVPLIERTMDAIRRMLTEGGHLPLNREGAAGFCDGSNLFFVAGVLGSKVRDYLNRNEIRESHAAGVPEDNARLFDVWADYGALVLNGGNAIWRITVTLNREGGAPWQQTFTVLRFPLATLYSSPSMYPPALAGTIEISKLSPDTTSIVAPSPVAPASQPLAPTSPSPKTAPANTVVSQETAATNNQQSVAPAISSLPPWQSQATTERVASESPAPSFASLSEESVPIGIPEDLSADAAVTPAVTPPPIIAPAPPPQPALTLPSNESAAAAFAQFSQKPKPLSASSSPPAVLTPPVAPAQTAVPSMGNTVSTDVGAFLGWIQQGVANGTLQFNRSDTAVHFVAEGMFLISPVIFRNFGRSGEGIKQLQRELQQSGYVARQGRNTFLHTYNVTNARGRTMVTGYIVPNPKQFFNPVPPCNDVLKRTAPIAPES